MRKLLLLLAPFLIGACDPISEDQCRTGDWAGIGLADGTKGRPASILNEYTDICGALGVAPERAIYLAARQQGLQSYCTPQSAYDIGRRGGRINPVCNAAQSSAMAPAFNHGQSYYELSEIIRELDDEIEKLKRVLADLPESTDATDGATDAAQAADIRRIKRRISKLDDRVFDLERDQRRYARWP